jgi:hypothetical protein
MYEKQIENLIIEKILSHGLIEVKPAKFQRKSVHAFWDPTKDRTYITYTSGYIQVSTPSHRPVPLQKRKSVKYSYNGSCQSPLNPKKKIVRTHPWGTCTGYQYIMIPTEMERLMRILSILELRKKRAKLSTTELSVQQILSNRWEYEAIKK